MIDFSWCGILMSNRIKLNNCLLVYVVEIILKILGLGVHQYFDSHWNRSVSWHFCVLKLTFRM